jgi:excisionase family DNA binding protein
MALDVMTAEQAAEFLQTSVHTVKRRAREGSIPAAKIGREWRFLKSELEAWLAAGGTHKRSGEQTPRAPRIPETTPTMWGTARLREVVQRLKTELEGLYGERLKGLYLYGSRARGDARPDSDVDIAVVLDDFESPYAEISDISRVTSRLGLEADLVISSMPVRHAEWAEKETIFLKKLREEAVAVA